MPWLSIWRIGFAKLTKLLTNKLMHGVRTWSSGQVQPRQSDLSTAQVDEHTNDLSSGQVPPLTELSAIHWKIIDLCDVPRRLADILEALGVTNRGYFKKHHLDPLIKSGIVAMTNPEKTSGIEPAVCHYRSGSPTKGPAHVGRRRPK